MKIEFSRIICAALAVLLIGCSSEMGAEAEQILPAIPIYTPPAEVTHNTLGHVSNRRTKQLDVGLHKPSGPDITCPICCSAHQRRRPDDEQSEVQGGA